MYMYDNKYYIFYFKIVNNFLSYYKNNTETWSIS